jgi:hypothetical protein
MAPVLSTQHEAREHCRQRVGSVKVEPLNQMGHRPRHPPDTIKVVACHRLEDGIAWRAPLTQRFQVVVL